MRLTQAALELSAERGYERTTEVLFAGGEGFEAVLVAPVAAAAATRAPLEAATAGLESVGEFLDGRLELARRRTAIIAASAELRERELIKLASLGESLRQAPAGARATARTPRRVRCDAPAAGGSR